MRMTFALVGNPNCGKTALFNAMTKSYGRVGNFPGVTVEKKVAPTVFDKSVTLVDLPGISSLSPYSDEERVTAEFLRKEKIDCIICAVDGTAPENGLRLALRVLSLKIPTVVAVTMADEIKKEGGSADILRMSEILGTAAVTVSAVDGIGFRELLLAAKNAKKPLQTTVFGEDVESEKALLNIAKKASSCINFNGEKRRKRTEITDRILCNSKWSFLLFALFIFAVFAVTFGTFGVFAAEKITAFSELIKNAVTNSLLAVGTAEITVSLLCDGVISGVFAVLQFVPVLALLFFFIALAEETGYAARVAVIFDGIAAKIGLSGRSVIPLLLGFGCSVPAIMSARCLSSAERKKVVLAVPFISCSAKIAVYSAFVSVFFKQDGFLVTVGLYLLGISCACALLVFSKSEKHEPFITELPFYRLPSFFDIMNRVWRRIREFLTKTFSVILLSSVAVRALTLFDFSLSVVSAEQSILAEIGKILAPIFSPLGFSSWQAVAALVSGLLSKESVVATFAVLGGIEKVFPSSAAAMSFLVFILLYSPCSAALSALKREAGRKAVLFSSLFQTAVAYVFAAVFFWIAK